MKSILISFPVYKNTLIGKGFIYLTVPDKTEEESKWQDLKQKSEDSSDILVTGGTRVASAYLRAGTLCLITWDGGQHPPSWNCFTSSSP